MSDDRRIGSIDHLAGQPVEDDEYPFGIPKRVFKQREAMIDELLRPHREARKFEASSDSRKTVGDCKHNRFWDMMQGPRPPEDDDQARVVVTVTVTLEGQADDLVLHDVLRRPGVFERMLEDVREELLDALVLRPDVQHRRWPVFNQDQG